MSSGFLEELKANKFLNQICVGQGSGLIDFAKFPFFKVPSEFHQKFDVVWYDSPFDLSLNWRTVLDEMVRMLKVEGRIVISVRANGSAKVCWDYQRVIASIKMHLFRRVGLQCEVEFEEPKIYLSHCRGDALNVGDKVTMVFKIKRQNISIYQDRSWTFAMITGGKNVENVKSLCRSVDGRGEILICGPQNSAYDEFGVRYLDHSKYRDDYVEICKKKNDLAALATGQNLLIAHDRFVLGEDFFSGFEEFGYDFDFVAPRILNKKGEETDCWFVLGKDIFDKDVLRFGNFFVASSAFVLKDAKSAQKYDLSYSFLSGGCLIFKRDILRQIKFNELIFWHQIEDWELSARLLNCGILSQMNRFSSVINLRDDVPSKNSFVKKTLPMRFRKSLAKRLMKISQKLIQK